MEFLAALLWLALILVAPALARKSSGCPTATIIWLAVWPLVLGGYVFGVAYHGLPEWGGRLGWSVLIISLLLAIAAVWHTGRLLVAVLLLGQPFDHVSGRRLGLQGPLEKAAVKWLRQHARLMGTSPRV